MEKSFTESLNYDLADDYQWLDSVIEGLKTITKDNKIYLYNSNLARVPGINPVVFNTLDEYGEFLDWQKSQNINLIKDKFRYNLLKWTVKSYMKLII